jgi:hypothetical protein
VHTGWKPMELWYSDYKGLSRRCLEHSSSMSRSPQINLPPTSWKIETHPTVRLLTAVEEKVHDGNDVTVLQVVTHLMVFKSKYNFLN